MPSLKENRKTIRVVLAEDQGMVLGALAALLEIEGDMKVTAKARNGKEAIEAVRITVTAGEKPDKLENELHGFKTPIARDEAKTE